MMRNIPKLVFFVLLTLSFEAHSDQSQTDSASKINSVTFPDIKSSIPASIVRSTTEKLNDQDNETFNRPTKARELNWVEIESFRVMQDGLISQKSMDDSAKEMVRISEFTLLLMALSLFLSIWGIWLLKRTLEATRSANKTASDSINQARKANEIAFKNLEETQRVNVLQLQPWLSIEQPILDLVGSQTSSNDGYYKLYLPIRNEGKTPISDIKIEFSNMVVAVRSGSSITQYNSAKTEILSKNPINPGERKHFEVKVLFNELSSNHKAKKIRIFTHADQRYSVLFKIRVKDRFTPLDKHRLIPVMAIRADKESDPGKFEDHLTMLKETEEFDVDEFRLDAGESLVSDKIK